MMTVTNIISSDPTHLRKLKNSFCFLCVANMEKSSRIQGTGAWYHYNNTFFVIIQVFEFAFIYVHDDTVN